MPADKALHESIARQVKRAEKDRYALRSIEPTIIRERPSFPRLTRPKRGVWPDHGYDYWTPKVWWTAECWWRFKRAAYAQGKHAMALTRELMQQVVDDYERTLKP
jgi:hypothetical protein